MADQGKTGLSHAAKLVKERLDEQIVHLGGLEDRHIKFITYIVKHHLGFQKFRFEIRYLDKPKTLTIHIFAEDGTELFVKPKPADMIDKMNEYLNLPLWRFDF